MYIAYSRRPNRTPKTIEYNYNQLYSNMEGQVTSIINTSRFPYITEEEELGEDLYH